MQISWIDDADINQLLAAIQQPGSSTSPPTQPSAKPQAEQPPAPGPATAEASPAPSAMNHSMRQRLEDIRQRALRSGALMNSAATPQPCTDNTTASDPRQALLDFLARHSHNSGGLLLADDRGNILGAPNHEALSVIHELQTWINANRVGALFADGSQTLLRRQTICGKHLLAMPCPSRQGLYHLALYAAEPPLPEHLPVLRAELLKILEH